jgi:uncharacterized protein YdiU (UPF0061 family)
MHTLLWTPHWLKLSEAFYQRVQPSPLPTPTVVNVNRKAAQLIGLTNEQLNSETMLRCFSGDKLLPAMGHAADSHGLCRISVRYFYLATGRRPRPIVGLGAGNGRSIL